jgi:tetratricopeptide (TPR) repeat protein
MALPPGRDATDREALYLLGWVYTRQGRYAEAIQILSNLPEGPFLVTKLGALGEANACAGDIDAARDALKALENLAGTGYVSPRSAIYIYAGLREWDRAFEELERACAEHSPWMPSINVDPRFEEVRQDPRFIDLLRRMRLL